MDELKELLEQMYHISGVKQTDDAVQFILGIIVAKDAEIALLKAALEAVEYVDFNDCPWCGLPKYNNNTGDVIGHAPDCLRQRALGLEANNV